MAEMLIQSENLVAIADKIRVLKGITDPMSLDDMDTQLDIPKNNSDDLTASGATVTVPAGYYATQATKSVATATQATPSVSIDSEGNITASATQAAGYVSAGTKTGTKQLTTQAAKTITPSTSEQTAIAAGTYASGAVTVAAIPSDYKQIQTKSGSFTTNRNGTATIRNVGFKPDLVFVTLNETTYGDSGEYNQSVTLLFDESPDTGYCNSLMWSNDSSGEALYLCDIWGKQTSNGFQFWFNWILITTGETYEEAYTFHYVAIKYT